MLGVPPGLISNRCCLIQWHLHASLSSYTRQLIGLEQEDCTAMDSTNIRACLSFGYQRADFTLSPRYVDAKSFPQWAQTYTTLKRWSKTMLEKARSLIRMISDRDLISRSRSVIFMCRYVVLSYHVCKEYSCRILVQLCALMTIYCLRMVIDFDNERQPSSWSFHLHIWIWFLR